MAVAQRRWRVFGPQVPRADRLLAQGLGSLPARPIAIQLALGSAHAPDRGNAAGRAALVAEGHIRLADGTLVSCANYPGCASKSHFALASYGYCPSHSQFVWAMCLIVVSDLKGVPVGYKTWSAPRPGSNANRCSSWAATRRAASCSETRGRGDASSTACWTSSTSSSSPPNATASASSLR
jgi:hypothetical protein